MTNEEIAFELKELRRAYYKNAMAEIEAIFAKERVTMSTRSQGEQDLLGSYSTVLESDIKNVLKSLI